jgi:group II intron reverse transcriptase/maturase
MMDDAGKSDRSVVPEKLPNKVDSSTAEAVEGRDLTKGNTSQQNTPRTQCRTSVPSALERVRQAARRDRGARFTALFHHVTVDRLRAAYHSIKKEAAPGVDGTTWEQYGVELEARLRTLHDRLRRGAYRAKPSRRVYIPKADGRQRPIGVAALEDKVVQKAVAEVMNAVYEEDFLGFSYGFRPRRSQHQALDALNVGIINKKVNYVLDADIRSFFDTIDHGWLVKFIEHRIADRRILRLVQKWLTAGVLEGGARTEVQEGTPQGATISPLLANIFLHYVLDLWVRQWRNREANGEVIIVRYCDDFIVGFQRHEDAVKFLADLRSRMQRFGLELHPEKTRLVAFGRYAAERRRERGLSGHPETFNFLGFTHICATTGQGKFLLMRRTIRQRMAAKLKEVAENLMRRRHLPIPIQGRWLGQVVRGYYAYYAVPTNIHSMQAFRTQVERHWRHALSRRSQRGRLNWDRMRCLSARWIPPPRILHPWPTDRFDVTTRGRSRVR